MSALFDHDGREMLFRNGWENIIFLSTSCIFGKAWPQSQSFVENRQMCNIILHTGRKISVMIVTKVPLTDSLAKVGGPSLLRAIASSRIFVSHSGWRQSTYSDQLRLLCVLSRPPNMRVTMMFLTNRGSLVSCISKNVVRKSLVESESWSEGDA
jgi:hypothetical protein